MYSKNRIGNRNVHSKLTIVVFQINSISSIESEEIRETSNISFCLIIFRARLTIIQLFQNNELTMDIEMQNRPSTSNEPPPPYDIVSGSRVSPSSSCTIRK